MLAADETRPPTDLVVDTSAVMAVLLNEPHREKLIRAAEGLNLVSAQSLPAEIGNALSALLKRKRIDVAHARQAVEEFQKIPLTLIELDLAKAVELAASQGLYAYDAYMLATAMSRQCPLLTLDSLLAEACRRFVVDVIEVT